MSRPQSLAWCILIDSGFLKLLSNVTVAIDLLFKTIASSAPAIIHPLHDSTARLSSSSSTSSTASIGIVFQSWLLVENFLRSRFLGKTCICRCPTELAGYAWNANSKSSGLHLTKFSLSASKSLTSVDSKLSLDSASA